MSRAPCPFCLLQATPEDRAEPSCITAHSPGPSAGRRGSIAPHPLLRPEVPGLQKARVLSPSGPELAWHTARELQTTWGPSDQPTAGWPWCCPEPQE